jgi:Tfp pilus assembly protein PilF
MKVLILITGMLVLSACAGTFPKPDEPESQLTQERKLAAELVGKADQAVYSDDPRSAAYLYEEAVRINDTADIWMRLGFVYEQLDDVSKALNAYATALEKDPQRAGAYQQVANIYLSRKLLESANLNFNRALEIDDTLWLSWMGMGIAADLAGDYGVARGYYEKAIQVNPTSKMLWNNYGYSAYLAGHYIEAQTAFREALRLDGDYKPAWINLGLLRARQKDYDHALELLAKVQSEAVSLNDIGYVALLNGDLNTAEDLIRKAISVSPRYYEAAYRNLEKLESARDSNSAVRSAKNTRSQAKTLVYGHALKGTSANCADSGYPEMCSSCELTDNPPLCMVRFLQGLGNGTGKGVARAGSR